MLVRKKENEREKTTTMSDGGCSLAYGRWYHHGLRERKVWEKELERERESKREKDFDKIQKWLK